MNKVSAERTSLAFQAASAMLSIHLDSIRDTLSKKEFKEYADKTGKVMGEIYVEVLRPLWEEHPEFLPKQMEGEYIVNEQMHKEIQEILAKYAPSNS